MPQRKKPMPKILEIKKLVKKFGGLHACDHANFAIEENSITGLIGPNGAGKTTVFDLISGFLESDAGEIHFRHENITSIPPWKRASLGIGRTFQAVRLFPELSVIDNVLAALPNCPDGFLDIFRPLKKRKHELREQAMDYLRLANLHEHSLAKASSLSYGQQKLLEIIRAAASGSDLLLLDEPAAGVNRTMLHHIVELIKKLKSQGKTIIIVEHDMGFVMSLCEKIIVMDRGKEIAEGSPHEIQKNPQVLSAYLGAGAGSVKQDAASS